MQGPFLWILEQDLESEAKRAFKVLYIYIYIYIYIILRLRPCRRPLALAGCWLLAGLLAAGCWAALLCDIVWLVGWLAVRGFALALALLLASWLAGWLAGCLVGWLVG